MQNDINMDLRNTRREGVDWITATVLKLRVT
jgi:hypothetical protein